MNMKTDLDRIMLEGNSAFTALRAERDTLQEALQAIVARIDGVWEHPALRAYGPLLPVANDDIRRIAQSVFRRNEMKETESA